MLRWTTILIACIIVTGILGFSGVSAALAAIAKTLFFVCLTLFIATLIKIGIKNV